jgi:hypothetical protein
MQLVTGDQSLNAARTRRRTAVLCLVLALAGLLAHDLITAHSASSAGSGSAAPFANLVKVPGGFHPAPAVPAATTLAKHVWAVVDGASGGLVRGSHAVSARICTPPTCATANPGRYVVTFDRHLDNCALAVSVGLDGTITVDGGPTAPTIKFGVLDSGVAGGSTKQVLVFPTDLGGNLTPSDFHIIGLCPSS